MYLKNINLQVAAGEYIALVGASGVGKSSLLNSMYPSLNLETGDLSEKLMRGKNTTRHTELHKVGEHTYIGDSPGFTRLELDKKVSYEEKNKDTDIEVVRENIRRRDFESIEVTKTLVVTDDAIVIDSTHISSEEVVKKIVETASPVVAEVTEAPVAAAEPAPVAEKPKAEKKTAKSTNKIEALLGPAQKAKKQERSTIAVYLSKENQTWLKEMATQRGKSVSELLDQILNELRS